MKANVIKSTTYGRQVLIIAPNEDLIPWWNEIANCMYDSVRYHREHNHFAMAKHTLKMIEEIDKQLKGDE